jgi:phosphopantetheinyl transferase
LKVLAYQILSRQERGNWHESKMTGKRRFEWLMGRAVAKDAVRKLLKRKYELDLCPADIEIETNKNGQPFVNGVWTKEVDCIPSISIAHTKGVAAAIATAMHEAVKIGIDIECLRSLEDGFLKKVFNSHEEQLLSTIDDNNFDKWVLRLWCAKEAVAKAIGIGFNGDPNNYIVQNVDVNNGSVNIKISEKLANIIQKPNDTNFLAQTICEDSIIVAVATYKKEN